MIQQWKIFLTAIMFLTRIRVPKTIDHSPAMLQKSPRYFPLVGWVVGGVSVIVFLAVNKFFSENIAILASMVTGILTTGAFHEDGFADVCDGFGGGWTKEKILMIMKDSRLGTFGVIGLISMLSTKFILLQELPKFTPPLPTQTDNPLLNYSIFAGIIVTAHALSRLMPIVIMQRYEYVVPEDNSKAKPIASTKLSFISLIVAIVIALLPFLLLPLNFLFAILPMLIVTYSMAQYFKKWIGGYTGDCLGAVQQVTEIVFYLSVLVIWRYF